MKFKTMCFCVIYRVAKEKKLRIWKDYSPSGPAVDIKDKNFTGKVYPYIL